MADQRHADRAHATWSASASERRWDCAGSLALEMDGPPDKESHAAAWGTAAHEVAETALRNGPGMLGISDCNAQLGEIVSTKSHKIEVDDEVAETAQEFVDYVRRRMEEYHAATGKEAILLIEQKFSLADLDPPFDAGGTGDAVLMFPEWGLIEIVDLKGGRGIVVEATGNKQLRTYGLGALMANPGPWRRVKVTIVQPRAPHPDGRIRSEEFDVAELFDWTADLLEAMHRAAQAAADVEKIGTAGTMEDWAGLYLSAGEHCTFCRAAATCPALQAKSLEVAQTHFTPVGVETPPAPDTLTMDQLVKVLDAADMVQNWLNAVRGHAQDLAEMGLEVKHGDSEYVLTEKQGRRAWKDMSEAELVKGLEEATGEAAVDFYNEPKLMSPAQAEKVLGAKRKGQIADLWEKKSSGFNLVRKDKTTRAAAVAPPQQFFQPQ